VAERGKVIERSRIVSLPEETREISESDALAEFDRLLKAALASATSPGETPGLLFDGRIEACVLLAGLRAQDRHFPLFALGGEENGTQGAAAFALRLAKMCKAEAVITPFGAKDFFAILPKVVACLDDPGADYAAVFSYRLAAAAGTRAGALLTSAGGDVLFGGLGRYRSALRPLWLGGKAMRARGFLEGLGVLREDGPAWRDGLRAVESRLAQRRLSPLQIIQALDCALWLPNEVLPALDRCLAAHSLGLRAPYLEPALARFAFTLPAPLKITSGRGSALLRRYLAETLPEAEPFQRHRGWAPSVTRWIAAKAGTLGPLVARNDGIGSICDQAAVRKVFERLSVRPSKRLGHAAWQLLFFALWHRIHIEGKIPEGDACTVLA
jgi:asparagine synthase (glutamine-hydrolysing)